MAVALPISARRRLRAPSNSTFGLLLALPAVLVTVVLLAYPLVYSLWASLHTINYGTNEWEWVGLRNYSELLSSDLFLPATFRTLYFAAIVTVLTTVLGLLFALALDGDFPGRDLLRGLMIIPWSLSQVMLALTFGWIFNSTYGPLNGLLLDLHVIDHYVPWFSSGPRVMIIMALAYVWSLLPLSTLLLLGALQTVPADLHKAARVDGARAFQRFRLVTFPWIRATVLIVIVLGLLNSFMAFALIYVLTGGGPGTETTVLAWWGYSTGFRDLNLGLASAIFYVMTVMIVAISTVTIIALGRERHGR